MRIWSPLPRDIRSNDPSFGYSLVADELPEKDITAGEITVHRLGGDHRIWSVFSKKQGLNRKQELSTVR